MTRANGINHDANNDEDVHPSQPSALHASHQPNNVTNGGLSSPSSDNNTVRPAYAAATLIYGLHVDADDLIYSSRAFHTHETAWLFLAACEKNRIKRDTSSSSSSSSIASTSPRTTITDLPREVIQLIKSELARMTYEENVCESWRLFGSTEMHKYHPTYCCQPDRERDINQWPERIQARWNSALDEFHDHFSFSIPKCVTSCGRHPVCETIRIFLQHYDLCLADCAFTLKGEPNRWLVAHKNAYVNEKRHFEYHVRLDTGDIEYRMVRQSCTVREDFQESQLKTRNDFIRFREQSGCKLAEGTSRDPAFHLVVLAETAS